MLGLGHAILTGEPLIGNEPFAVILADDLCDHNSKGVIAQMIEIYKKYRCSIIAIEEIPLNDAHKYGVITGNLISGTNDIFKVTNMLEKPTKSDLNKLFKNPAYLEKKPALLGIIGRYILTPDIFDILRKTKRTKGKEIQITDALNTQAKQGKVLAYKFKGTRFDCGSIEGYLKATNHFANKLDIF